MVARVALLVLVTCACAVRPRCTSGSEFEPTLCPLVIPQIESLGILENAAKAHAEYDPEVSCSEFRVAESTIRRYLVQAKVAPPEEVHRTLDYSPCYASGTLTLRDGRKGSWSVSQFKVGLLSIADDEPLVLYCPSCEFPPFL
jgi:hypothetical protein